MAAKLTAQLREETGKGAARRARRLGLIPAVLYGHTLEKNLHLNLPGHEAFLIVKDNPNAIINLEVDGKSHLVLIKEIQRHPVRRDILHIDLLEVRRDEKVEVEVPVVLVGESAINVEGWEEGRVLYARDLELPAGVTTTLDGDHDVLSITLPEEMPEEPAAGEGESAAEPAKEEAAEEE